MRFTARTHGGENYSHLIAWEYNNNLHVCSCILMPGLCTYVGSMVAIYSLHVHVSACIATCMRDFTVSQADRSAPC